ncbi:SDR family oxidoreductase [Mucilaginibacter endophyticus]|nr:SDR family oxidoreductase [Mucilaginibacter endophyticus]
MEQQFKGKTALIVGGSSGIGKETTKQLLQQGASPARFTMLTVA